MGHEAYGQLRDGSSRGAGGWPDSQGLAGRCCASAALAFAWATMLVAISRSFMLVCDDSLTNSAKASSALSVLSHMSMPTACPMVALVPMASRSVSISRWASASAFSATLPPGHAADRAPLRRCAGQDSEVSHSAASDASGPVCRSRTGTLREPIPYRVAPRAHRSSGRSASPSVIGSLREPIGHRVAPRAHRSSGRSASPSVIGSLREPIGHRVAPRAHPPVARCSRPRDVPGMIYRAGGAEFESLWTRNCPNFRR